MLGGKEPTGKCTLASLQLFGSSRCKSAKVAPSRNRTLCLCKEGHQEAFGLGCKSGSHLWAANARTREYGPLQEICPQKIEGKHIKDASYTRQKTTGTSEVPIGSHRPCVPRNSKLSRSSWYGEDLDGALCVEKHWMVCLQGAWLG